jgi:YihY family inner membrane protein
MARRDIGDVTTRDLEGGDGRAAERVAERPRKLPRASWKEAVKRTAREFKADNLQDWAAALTYFSVLSIFPGLLVLVSIVSLTGRQTMQSLIGNLGPVVPGSVNEILGTALASLEQARGSAGLAGIISLVVALWSASGYVAAFMRASNEIYDVPEGRPIWKTLPIRLGVTLTVMVLLVVTLLMVVVTGTLARQLGDLLGLGTTAVTVWNIAKWPVLVILVSFMFSLLYWASPNARQGFRWVSPGGLVAVLLWIVASALFAIYVANFGNYNRIYGSLAAVVIFLIWLWISNIAILLGAELNAELVRSRAIGAGHPAQAEPYMELRDTRKLEKGGSPS